MNTAAYSLLTLRPDPERIDMLCVGAVVLDANGSWHVSAPGPRSKLLAFAAEPDTLTRMAVNLEAVLRDCTSLASARAKLTTLRSALALHVFEGLFSYASEADFGSQVQAILKDSVVPTVKVQQPNTEIAPKVIRPRTRARLRKQFESMGIMAKHSDEIADHKVVYNFPVSTKHGLTAEFALRNSVMHITETVDFDVSDESVRAKTYEAQAKCLVLQASLDAFGSQTQRHIVVSGSGAAHAARTVDLLSTVGELYATENAQDMENYIKIIAKAAGNPVMPSA
jgi:hypothetical protein